MDTPRISVPPRFHVRLNDERRAVLAAHIESNPCTPEKAASELLSQKLDELAGRPKQTDPIEVMANNVQALESKVAQLVAMLGQSVAERDAMANAGHDLAQIRGTLEQFAARPHLTPADLAPLLNLSMALMATVGQLAARVTSMLPAKDNPVKSFAAKLDLKPILLAPSKLVGFAKHWSASWRGTLGFGAFAMVMAGVLAWPLSEWEARFQRVSATPASKIAPHEMAK